MPSKPANTMPAPDRLTMTPEAFRTAENAAMIRGAARMQEHILRMIQADYPHDKRALVLMIRALRADEVALAGQPSGNPG